MWKIAIAQIDTKTIEKLLELNWEPFAVLRSTYNARDADVYLKKFEENEINKKES